MTVTPAVLDALRMDAWHLSDLADEVRRQDQGDFAQELDGLVERLLKLVDPEELQDD